MERKLAAATQQQALSALLFLYRNVVGRSLEELGRLRRGRVPSTLPVVLTRGEVARLVAGLRGTHRLGPPGAYNDRTDSEDAFEVVLMYAVFDTLLHPFPPREPDGSFVLGCTASVTVSSQLMLRQEGLPVRFWPSLADVVPTEAELREGAP